MLKRNAGFTLIEITVVMAVAGLILGIMLVAISGAQVSRRDGQRKYDLGRLNAQLEVYAENHVGQHPTTDSDPATGFLAGFTPYLPATFDDPLVHTPYVMGVGAVTCDGTQPMASHGPGYISYEVPGDSGNPFKLTVCLERGEFSLGK